MMKAAILPDKHQPLSIQEHPIPHPKPGEAIIRLKAAALNRRDLWIQKGQYAGLQYPALLGSDGAGIVETVGDTADMDWIGKEVIINPSLHWGNHQAAPQKSAGILGMPTHGTLAEYVIIPTENLARKPGHVSWHEAAALPLAGLTAYRALFYRGELQKGQKLLITGAGGGAAQIALAFAIGVGAEVWVTTSSADKLKNCQESGAAGGVLYTHDDWDKELKVVAGTFDLVLDSAGGPEFDKLLELAADGGKVVLFGGTAGVWPAIRPQRVFWKQLSIMGTTMGSPNDFADMVSFVNTHKIRPAIGGVFELENINSAFSAMEAGKLIGKIVVQIS